MVANVYPSKFLHISKDKIMDKVANKSKLLKIITRNKSVIFVLSFLLLAPSGTLLASQGNNILGGDFFGKDMFLGSVQKVSSVISGIQIAKLDKSFISPSTDRGFVYNTPVFRPARQTYFVPARHPSSNLLPPVSRPSSGPKLFTRRISPPINIIRAVQNIPSAQQVFAGPWQKVVSQNHKPRIPYPRNIFKKSLQNKSAAVPAPTVQPLVKNTPASPKIAGAQTKLLAQIIQTTTNPIRNLTRPFWYRPNPRPVPVTTLAATPKPSAPRTTATSKPSTPRTTGISVLDIASLKALFTKFLAEQKIKPAQTQAQAPSSGSTFATIEQLKNELNNLDQFVHSRVPANPIIFLGSSAPTGGSSTTAIGSNDTEFKSTKVTADNIVLDGNTISTTAGDLTIDSAGKTVLSDTVQINGPLQVSGVASAAYSRFGTSIATQVNYISAANDVLISGDVQVVGTGSFQFASASAYFGLAFPTTGTNGCNGTSDRLNWNNLTGKFSCNADLTGAGSSTSSVRFKEISPSTNVISYSNKTASLSFEAGAFALSNSSSGSSEVTVRLDYTNGPASRAMNNTWTSQNVFSAGASFTTNIVEFRSIASHSALALFNAGASVTGTFEITTNGKTDNQMKLTDSTAPAGKGTFALSVNNGNFQIRAPSVSSAFSAENVVYSVSSSSLATTIGTAASSSLRATLISGSSTNDVFVSGRYAYMADQSAGLKIVDISQPASPSLKGTLATTNAVSIYVAGRYAYLGDGSTVGFKIVDISNPSSPVLKSTLRTVLANKTYVSGRYAYVADNTSPGLLSIVDISNPSFPVVKSTTALTDTALGIYVSGRYAYVADRTAGLKIFDISNPSAPVLKGTLVTTLARDVYVSGRYAYLADDVGGFRIIDVSNPSSPTLKSSLPSTQAFSVYVAGRYAYLADITSFKVIDVSNPSSPVFKSSITLTGPNGIYVAGKYAYVADGTGGLRIIDIGGVEVHSLYAGNIESNDITVDENVDIGNSLSVKNGINIGQGGIYSAGPISVNASGSTYLQLTHDKGPTLTSDMFRIEAAASASQENFTGNFLRFTRGNLAANTVFMIEQDGAVLASGAAQFGAVGAPTSVSYSRFGTSTTGHSNYMTLSNDLLISGDLEVKGTISAQFASASAFWLPSSSGLLSDCSSETQTLNWTAATGKFSCLSDATGGGSSTAFATKGLSLGTINGAVYTHVTSLSFDSNSFAVSNLASNGFVRINWGANGVASRSTANTWTAQNVFSAGASFTTNIVEFRSIASHSALGLFNNYASISPKLEVFNTTGTASLELFSGNNPQQRFTISSTNNYGAASESLQFLNNAGTALINISSIGYIRLAPATTNTTHTNWMGGANDLFVANDLEGRGSISFAGTASLSNVLFVKANGNVGIGTNAPGGTLDVLRSGTPNTSGDILGAGSFTDGDYNIGPSNNGTLALQSNAGATTDTGGTLVFMGRISSTTRAGFSKIKGAKENGTNLDTAGYLAFATRPSGGNNTE